MAIEHRGAHEAHEDRSQRDQRLVWIGKGVPDGADEVARQPNEQQRHDDEADLDPALDTERALASTFERFGLGLGSEGSLTLLVRYVVSGGLVVVEILFAH